MFSGVGKTAAEMEAALAAGIRCFNVESAAELDALNAVAGRAGRIAPVSLRVNPDVDPQTHPYIATGLKESKFGVAFADAPALYRRAAGLPHIAVRGIDCHIGSQITDLAACAEAAAKMFELVDRLERDGIALHHVDLGGGLGIRYRDEQPIDPQAYAVAVRQALGARRHELLFEPGRFLVGDAGVLLTRVIYLKPGASRDFAIVDAAMNDLIRPALYDAWHAVEPVSPRATIPPAAGRSSVRCARAAISSPRDRELALAAGDLLAVRAAGAYAFVMSSNYNSRPRASEVIVDGDRVHLARPRETHRRSLRARIDAAVIASRMRASHRARIFVCANSQQPRMQARNRRRNLAIEKNVARIQAAGSNGFVKRLQFRSTIPGAACKEAEAP